MKLTRKGFQRHALATAVVLALAGTAQAQLSTSTIQGQITSGAAAAQAGLQVTAVNLANGAVYRTVTRADGSYVLAGLAPGSYEIRVGNQKSQTVTVQVGETASVDLSVTGTQQVTIVGSMARKDVKNSESGTTVSRRQIETLPQVTRNFLAFADLAPGVRFINDPSSGYTRIQGGAQSSDRVNVFIDGMSQKNDLTRGGIAGQNESRGNPFPQSAIAEYKVITQNYKAEYGSVSSTAITAVTKSGTNTTQGDAFLDYAGDSQIAYSPFEAQKERDGLKRPAAKQSQFGASIGGAIAPNKVHYFLSYEGKDNTIPSQLGVGKTLDGVKVTPWLTDNILNKQWTTERQFHEDLLFGKLSVAIDDNNRLEFSAKFRSEKDQGSLQSDEHPDWGFSTPSNALHRTQKEQRLNAKWELSSDRWINEANAELFYNSYTPETVDMRPFIEYKRANWSGVMMDGRMEGRSRNKQSAFVLKDDFTFTGTSGHVIKAGASLNRSTYDVGGSRFAVPHYFVFITDAGVPGLVGDPGMPGADANNPAGASVFYPGWEPFSKSPAPATYVKYTNNKFGLYLQDDIALNKNVELNLGVRWDYEDNAFNNGYKTPSYVLAAMNAVDTRAGAAAGQTYAQSLAKGGINIKDYLSSGSERKAFTGAFQPRLGMSWDLKGDKSSVVVAGFGRAYDRTPAMKARDELINNAAQAPDGKVWEFWLLNNNMKMPYSDQFGLSLRQAIGDWSAEVGVQEVRGYNEFLWTAGGRNPDGSVPSGGAWFDPAGGNPPQTINGLRLGDTSAKTRTRNLMIKAEKPYTRASGWGAYAALTLSDAKTTATDFGAESSDSNQFNWSVGKDQANVWRKSIDVEKYRLVASASADNILPWGILLSGKITAGPGTQFFVTSCAKGWGSGCERYIADGGAFEQVDLMLSKEVKLPVGQKLTVRLDILNLFNKANYGKYDTWGGGPGNPQNAWGGDNANAGKPLGLAGPMRTVKFGMKYEF